MARYNEILIGRFNRSAQKLFGIKGDAPVASLMPEIGVAHPLQNGAENRYLEGWNLFGTFNNQPAVAAQFARFRLRNPVGSNVVAVVHKIMLGGTATDQPFIDLAPGTPGDLATIITPRPLDPRYVGNANLIISRSTTVAAMTTAIAQVIISAAGLTYDVIVDSVQELPILPGNFMDIGSNVANQQMATSIWWRERFLEESERS